MLKRSNGRHRRIIYRDEPGYWEYSMQRMDVSVKSFTLMAAVVCVSMLTSCGIGSGCKDTELQSSRSPDGQTIATVMAANCGAATDFFSYVSIRTDQVALRDKGMLFAYQGKPDITTAWKGPKELQIECKKCIESKIYRQVLKEGEYRIEYVGFTP